MFEVLPKARPFPSPVPVSKRLPSHVSLSPLALTMEKNVNIMKNWGRVLFPAAAHYFVERRKLLVCLHEK
jgi:hypothetical protein